MIYKLKLVLTPKTQTEFQIKTCYKLVLKIYLTHIIQLMHYRLHFKTRISTLLNLHSLPN